MKKTYKNIVLNFKKLKKREFKEMPDYLLVIFGASAFFNFELLGIRCNRGDSRLY